VIAPSKTPVFTRFEPLYFGHGGDGV